MTTKRSVCIKEKTFRLNLQHFCNIPFVITVFGPFGLTIYLSDLQKTRKFMLRIRRTRYTEKFLQLRTELTRKRVWLLLHTRLLFWPLELAGVVPTRCGTIIKNYCTMSWWRHFWRLQMTWHNFRHTAPTWITTVCCALIKVWSNLVLLLSVTTLYTLTRILSMTELITAP